MQKRFTMGMGYPALHWLICWAFLLFALPGVAEPRFIGNTTGRSIPANYHLYWNQVTSENAAKWASVEMVRDQYNWSVLDRDYQYAREHGFLYTFHNLIWGSSGPGWWGSLSNSDMRAEVEEWIRLVGERYTPDMVIVVNEPLHSMPVYRQALGGTGETGWDWVITSFELADQYCSGIKLINEYGIINSGEAVERYLKIIRLLQERNLIDGIGIQCHDFSLKGLDAATVQSKLDRLAQAGLPIYVTELDIQNYYDDEQLARYQEIFPVLYNHLNVHGITLWGYIRNETWQQNTHLVNSGELDAAERPALQWLKSYLGGTPGPLVTAAPYPFITIPTPYPTPVPLDYGQANLRFAPEEIHVLPGETFSQEIYIDTRYQDLASFDINIRFGAILIEPDPTAGLHGVTPGDDFTISGVENGLNYIRITGTAPAPVKPGTNRHLLSIHWRSLHYGSTYLNIDINSLTDSSVQNFSAPDYKRGKVYIDFFDGDVNHDGVTNIVDALSVAQVAVGLIFPWSTFYPEADGDCDGKYTIVDALIIAQISVGLIAGFPC